MASSSVNPARVEDRRVPRRPVIEVSLRGHLTSDALVSELAKTTKLIGASSGRVGLIVDCTCMTGYELGARTVFVEWNRANRDRVRRVAILTNNSMWRMVISVMSLASSTDMKPFDGRDEAIAWLDSQAE